MCIARKLGLAVGILFLLAAVGLVVLPQEYWMGVQLSFGLLAIVFVVCGLGLIGLTTSRLLWGDSSLSPSPTIPQAQFPKTLIWPWRLEFKPKGSGS